MLERKTQDFLYWHAVSKMRMAEFAAASKLFRLLHCMAPQRPEVSLGHAYCLMRTGELESASAVLSALRRQALQLEEMALLGRLYRRCDFERAKLRRSGAAPRPLQPLNEVRLPHTLADGPHHHE